ncbi:hypothetical protein [Kosmotoga sp. DU53]|uniref:hypothetical protein n=1 Tax=Kosmotoga sp. DU53 TaxID=1310160 RepID=UPI0007C568EA|nr:hypothetical protein [Kosmotoga sp. DU53]OAA23715.1 hypothetical protein DU53_02455 [Kosmotoga sp. DU53]
MAKTKRKKTGKTKGTSTTNTTKIDIGENTVKAVIADYFKEIYIDDEPIDPDYQPDEEGMELDDFSDDEEEREQNFTSEIYTTSLKDLGLGLESYPSLPSEDRVLIRVVKANGKYLCLVSGKRAFNYTKRVDLKYRYQVDFQKFMSKLALIVQSFLNGHFPFEEISRDGLKGALNAKVLDIEYRSLLTRNFISFWDGETWQLNVLTTKGRPNERKKAELILRVALGNEERGDEFKKRFVMVAKEYSDKKGRLLATYGVKSFLDDVIEVCRKYLVLKLGSDELIKILNNSKSFRELILKLREE